MDAIGYIGLAMGLAWASGINLYAAVAVLGILGSTGQMSLPAELAVLTNEWVIGAAVFMYLVEFFADKIPGLDSFWDAVHTFIRIPAGAVLAAQTMGGVGEEAQIIAFLLGGAVTTAAHGTKAALRLAINTSPEPVSNWTASVLEDVAALAAVIVSLSHPTVIIGFVVLFFLVALWTIPKLVRAFRHLLGKIQTRFRPKEKTAAPV
jgi:hypothetical protein